jgi:hypothetical protein
VRSWASKDALGLLDDDPRVATGHGTRIVRCGASSLTRNNAAGVTSSGVMSASAASGNRPCVMRVDAEGHSALTRMPYLTPSICSTFIRPINAVLAAP